MSSDKKDSPNSVEYLSQTGSGNFLPISMEVIKNTYIVEGLSAQELSDRFHIPYTVVDTFIRENELDKLRAAHIKHGLAQLQNTQLVQAEKLMTLESQFKKMRILQLEKILHDYMAYYSKYNHFYKVHPVSQEILKDTNGIPMQIKLPNITHEISQLKESFNLSEGLRLLLGQIDDIINRPKDVENINRDVVDITQYDNLFLKKPRDD